MLNHVVIDDWYENPDKIRNFALNKFKENKSFGEEKVKDNGYSAYPGYRCKTTIENLIENKLKLEERYGVLIEESRWIFASTCEFQSSLELLEFDFNTMSMKVKDSDIVLNISESLSNGCFQYCDENSQMWIHPDHGNTHAAVVYLSPDPPKGSGTGFFKNKKTGEEYQLDSNFVMEKDECSNFDNWELTDYVENMYNRCVIFNAKKFHSATKYFGKTLEDSRLFQVFFFNIK